ncbi:hypothetical protein [Methylobacterium haplocladii]|uniref:hypothetical protein n=1 Tax=Methylobacterium haplocladii TaxID=1176176 RepID=UPI00235D115B|nr:hypothetical protein [Methylobacterium haplocladii]GLS59609.1 hypothetical protein GCM10007887_22780 [Methylobacterium haplocladii]
MKTIAVLSAAAVLGVGALTSTGAEARWRGGGGAVAACVVGGLAVLALLGAATSGYGYGYGGYGYARPAYGYDGYDDGYAGGYRSVGYDDGYYAPRYRTRRVVRETYDYAPGGYSWGGPSYGGYDYDD